MQNFTELGLSEPLQRAITDLGFVTPTPIQEQTIPYLLENRRDLIARAQTGTGKTAAFGLPLLQNLKANERHTQAVVLAPTRELCLQITQDFQKFSRYMKEIRITAVYGGAKIETQIRSLASGSQIIIATPGRLVDILKRKKADLSRVNTVVLDEADEMLNMGFKDELEHILSAAPGEKTTLLFSATMSAEVRRIAGKYMKNAHEISAGGENKTAAGISHLACFIRHKERYAALRRIIDFYPDMYAIIFCRTREETRSLTENLLRDGYLTDALHGDLTQSMRETVMKKFRYKSLKLLVATDVAARGLDVNDLSHVIHYNIPVENEIYTHRCGRTARAGKQGMAIALAEASDNGKLKQLEKKAGITFEKMRIPTGDDIIGRQMFHLAEKIAANADHAEEYPEQMKLISEKLEHLPKQALVQSLITLYLRPLMDFYRDRPEISSPDVSEKSSDFKKDGKDGKRKKNSGNSASYLRVYLNVGKKDNIRKGDLLKLINKLVGGIDIGTIDILPSYTFLNVPVEHAPKVVSNLSGANLNGRKLSPDMAGPRKERDKPDHKKKSRKYKRKDG